MIFESAQHIFRQASLRTFLTSVLVLGVVSGLAGGSVRAAEDPALEGLKEMKVAFDITEGNPKALLAKLGIIEETRASLVRQGVTPRFVLAFRGEASRFTQTDLEKIKPEEREMAAKIAERLKAMKAAQGVDGIEQCSLPMRSRNIKSEDLLPEVKQVPNGWISLAAYQHKGYAYIAP